MPLVLGIAVVFGVYVATLYPSVAGGDSGELIAESCHLGTAHPPGYPLFTLVSWFFTQVLAPLGGSPAWRSNLLGALFDTASAAFVYLSVDEFLRPSAGGAARERRPRFDAPPAIARAAGALAAMGAFAFSPLIWMYATHAEVFAMNNALVGGIVFLAIRFGRTHSLRVAELGALACGIALCNQHTAVLYEVPLIGWILYTLWSIGELGAQRFAKLACLFFAGLLPYAYLPIAQGQRMQPGSWGDVRSAAGLLHHVRRADYGTFKLYAADEVTAGLVERLKIHAIDVCTRQMPDGVGIGGALALIGAALTLLPRRGLPATAAAAATAATATAATATALPTAGGGVAVFATLAFYEIVFHSLSNMPLDNPLLFGVHARFWQQPNFIIFVYFGVALAALFGAALRAIGAGSEAPPTKAANAAAIDKKAPRGVCGAAAQGAVLALACGVVALQGASHWEEMDQHESFYFDGYAKAIVAPLPPNALLLINYDMQWTSVRYLQRCEGLRPDVDSINLSMMTFKWFQSHHHLHPQLTFPGSHIGGTGFSFAAFLDANLLQPGAGANSKHGVPIFIGGELPRGQTLGDRYECAPLGLLCKVVRSGDLAGSARATAWVEESNRAWATVKQQLPQLPPPRKYSDETWEYTIARDYWKHVAERGTMLVALGTESRHEEPRAGAASSGGGAAAEAPPLWRAEDEQVELLAAGIKALEQVVEFDLPEYLVASYWKNLGLGYARLVQNKIQLAPRMRQSGASLFAPSIAAELEEWRYAPLDAAFVSAASEVERRERADEKQLWSGVASVRVLALWTRFVEHEDAKADPDYAKIAAMVRALTGATTRAKKTKRGGQSGGAGRKEKIPLTVPKGAKPGNVLTLTGPDGTVYKIPVPPGLTEGDTFEWELE